MRSKRKTVTMLVTVSVPRDHSAADARHQVRDILQSELRWDEHMKVRSVQPAAAILAGAEKARQAWGKPRYPKPSRRAKTPPLLEAMGAE